MTSEDSQRSEGAPLGDERRCPACDERIRAAAKRCRHCGESLGPKPPARIAARLISALGLLTAVLSLFYALREGYHFVSRQQQQRADVESYKNAAARFERMGNLTYAKVALDRALEVTPSDPELQLRAFLLEGQHRVVEIEDWGLQAGSEAHEAVPELVQAGFRLLSREYTPADRTRLLLLLGRLLAQDPSWKTDVETVALWEEALALAPEDPQVVFWRGHFLLGQAGREQEGLEAFRTATSMDPENAFYWKEIGEHGAELGATAEAIRALRRAIELRPKQTGLQRVRASNQAKGDLAKALTNASEEQPITGETFFGIPMDEREALVRLAEQSTGSRFFRKLAGRFYHARGLDEEALTALRGVVGDYESYVSASDLPALELMVEILERSGLEPETLPGARAIVDRRLEANRYDEILEIGSNDEGKHRYKLGLRTLREPSEEPGLLVVRAFDGYPFAKAGVREGDRILRFAHRSITKLRDIWIPLIEFAPGSDVPVQLDREGQTLDVTLIVE